MKQKYIEVGSAVYLKLTENTNQIEFKIYLKQYGLKLVEVYKIGDYRDHKLIGYRKITCLVPTLNRKVQHYLKKYIYLKHLSGVYYI